MCCKEIFILLSALCLTACTSHKGEDGSKVEIPTNSLRLTIPDFKDVSGITHPIAWSSNTSVEVNGFVPKEIKIDSNNSSVATFCFGDAEIASPYCVTSPCTNEGNIITLPNEQMITDKGVLPSTLPMCGHSNDTSREIKMRHLSAIVRLSVTTDIKGLMLEEIAIRSEREMALAGEFSIDCEKASLTPSANTSSIVRYTLADGVSLSSSEKSLLYLSLPPCALDDYTITLKSSNGEKMEIKWLSVATSAGNITRCPNIKFAASSSITIEDMVSEEDSIVGSSPTISGYIRDTNGDPIVGVAVSDGFSVVKSNLQGYYTMNVSQDAWYIYISTPSEYKIPLNEFGQPCFFKRYTTTSNRYDFVLERLEGGAENEFMLFGLADPQTGSLANVTRFANQTAPEIKAYSASLGIPCYGITLGDVISMGSRDISQDVLPAMREAMHADKIGMPLFQVMGNHDNCFMSTSHPVKGRDIREINLNIQRMFEETFGPINYSFNRGSAHIIGMRNVQWKSGDDCATDNTSTRFTEDQYRWLVEDLSCVDNKEQKVVILCVHIPLYNNGTLGDGSYRQEVLNLLDEFGEAHILSGHLHYQRNYDHTLIGKSTHKIYEHAQAAINGASWSSNINGDGAPNGYGVYHIFNGTIKDWYYKGYAQGMDSREYQMRLYRGNAITGAAIEGANKNGTKGYYQFGYDEDILLANIFNSDTAWRVEVYEDGVYSGNMTSLASYHWDVTYDELIGSFLYNDPKRPPQGVECGRDFWAVGVLCGYLGLNNGGLYYKHCYKMWKYKLKDKNAKVEVRATDRKGNTYTCSTITAGTDMAYALYNN